MSESTPGGSEAPEVREQDAVGRAEVMYVFELVDSPAITTGDVRGLTGCSAERAREVLTELQRDGKVRSRKTGMGYLWWRTDPDEDIPKPDLFEME
jgi:hypothetical protein